MTKLCDISLVFTQLPKLTSYLYVNLEIAAIALVIGWAAGLVIALIRINNVPVLKTLAALFVSVIRGTPIIVQLYIPYFGIPILLRYINYYNGTDFNINNIPGLVFAIIALGLNQSAFDSETIRASILSVDKGQI
ncbi:MAG: ABC transporter permease subunit [Clostridia bacterium]